MKKKIINTDAFFVSDKYIKSIAEGLLAYRIYLSKCDVSGALSEYSFYEPLQRMLSAKKDWIVKCEFPIPDTAKGKGDNKRIDFVLTRFSKDKKELSFLASIEIKTFLNSSRRPNINQVINDNNKLIQFQKIRKIGKHASWILILHNSTKQFSEKLIEKGFKCKKILIKCVNKTYVVEIIKVEKEVIN